MRVALGPWAVSGPALFIGRQALLDAPWQLLQARLRSADAVRLDAILAEAGLVPLGGTALFRLAKSPAASRVARLLAEAGILVRVFPAQPEWMRFGLPGTSLAWSRLQNALASIVSSSSA